MFRKTRRPATIAAALAALLLTLTGCQGPDRTDGMGTGGAGSQQAAGDGENANRGATNGDLGGAGDFDGGGLLP